MGSNKDTTKCLSLAAFWEIIGQSDWWEMYLSSNFAKSKYYICDPIWWQLLCVDYISIYIFLLFLLVYIAKKIGKRQFTVYKKVVKKISIFSWLKKLKHKQQLSRMKFRKRNVIWMTRCLVKEIRDKKCSVITEYGFILV